MIWLWQKQKKNKMLKQEILRTIIVITIYIIYIYINVYTVYIHESKPYTFIYTYIYFYNVVQPVHKNLLLNWYFQWTGKEKMTRKLSWIQWKRHEEKGILIILRMLLLIFKCVPLRAGHNYLIISILQVKLTIELDVFVL